MALEGDRIRLLRAYEALHDIAREVYDWDIQDRSHFLGGGMVISEGQRLRQQADAADARDARRSKLYTALHNADKYRMAVASGEAKLPDPPAVEENRMKMRERIARAIFNATFHHFDVENGLSEIKWNEWPDDRRRAEKQADAVLEALRTPTREMDDAMRDVTGAGYPYSPTPLPPLGYLQVGLIWKAALDAARKPFPGPAKEDT